jgi:hypothetical protein
MSAMLGGVAIFAAQGSAQNLLVNPGFEDPITQDGPPFVGFWEGFSGGAGASASNSNIQPHSGAQHLLLSIAQTDNTFAGAFQDVAVVAGQQAVFSGFNKSAGVFDIGAEFRIEWRNATTEVGRTPNSFPTLTSDYTPFSLTATVPAGAEIARVVYAIQSFGAGGTNNGTVYVDDVSLTVPEPTSLAALTLGGLVVTARRRRPS